MVASAAHLRDDHFLTAAKRALPSPLMRTNARCPKCSGTKLFVCENTQPDWDSSNVVHPFHVTTVERSTDETGAREGSRYRSHVGRYETWICAACGFTEWYAKDAQALLDKLASIPRTGVRVVGGDAPRRPYR
jgi:predicted nucleic-acid-binding Zn-ribbon protein